MRSVFSRSAVAAFELVFRPWMRSRIHAIHVALPAAPLPRGRPLLLAANHVSWWDAFVLREVQRSLRPGAPVYTLMSRRELARFPFFRRLGVVGIDGASPASVARALRGLEARLARDPDAVVQLFPQGRIWPSYRRPLGFRRGVELFARRLAPLVVPVAVHAEPLNAVAPTFFVALGDPLEGAPAAAELERAVEAGLDTVLGFLATHGEDAPRAWPPRPVRVEAGRSVAEGPG